MPFLRKKNFSIWKKATSSIALFFGKFLGKRKKNPYNPANQVDLDRKLVHSLSRSKIPTLRQLKYLKKFLSSKELWLIRFLSLVIIVNLGVLGFGFYKNNFQEVPTRGGEYTEGLTGSPQYINPLYASVSDVDSDITSLIFSGLFQFDPEQGLSKDLVEDYSVSEDRKSYDIKLREDAKWHHGEKVTADDVVFTFNTIKDPDYDSPLRSRFSGVNIEKLDDHSVRFDLRDKKPDFLNLLTFGILPSDLWRGVTPQSIKLTKLNLEEPIGSGPYELDSLVKDSQGSVLSYSLKPNDDYYGQSPFIEELNFKFFVSPEEAISALNNNEIDGLGHLSPDREEDLIAKGSLNIRRLDLPRVNSLFFNQEVNPLLEKKEVREALHLGLNKDKIVSEVMESKGKRAVSPFPSYLDSYNSEVEKYEFDIDRAEELLQENDWTKMEVDEEEIEELKKIEEEIKAQEEQEEDSEQEGEDEDEEESEDEDNEELPELSEEQETKLKLGPGEWRVKATSSRESEEITFQDCLFVELTVPQGRQNIEVAQRIKEYWEKLGVRTDIREVSSGDMVSQVINPADFEVLLYAQVFDIRPDLYPFWHSSEAEQGLNITGYSNEEVDELLEEIRGLEWDSSERKEKHREIQERIVRDTPLIPLYSSTYTYVQGNKIKGADLNYIISSRDRFSQVEEWYIKTGKKLVW